MIFAPIFKIGLCGAERGFISLSALLLGDGSGHVLPASSQKHGHRYSEQPPGWFSLCQVSLQDGPLGRSAAVCPSDQATRQAHTRGRFAAECQDCLPHAILCAVIDGRSDDLPYNVGRDKCDHRTTPSPSTYLPHSARKSGFVKRGNRSVQRGNSAHHSPAHSCSPTPGPTVRV